MIRRARWLFLLAIVLILGGTGFLFVTQKRLLRQQAPAKSEPLPPNTSATAQEWEYTKTEGDRVVFRVKAKNYRQVKEPSTFLLEGLVLEIHDPRDQTIDLVKTNVATFDTQAGTLYADGEVDITMGIPKTGAPRGRIVGIKSSKMNFDSKSSKVSTGERAFFSTDQGEGESIGADYDPVTRELHLFKDVKLNWRSSGPTPRLMHIETGELVYKEIESQILLFPWARMTRENFNLDGQNAVVFLKDGLIDRVETRQARGSDKLPGRAIEYAADFLIMNFTTKGEVQKIEGHDQAHLIMTSVAARTAVDASRLDLEFEAAESESTLKRALATGQSKVESKPVAQPGVALSPTRVLTSEVIEVNMRQGGQEIDKVVTHAPGRILFLPNRPADKKRQLDGERFYITYGKNNQIESFRAVTVTTTTETPARERGKPPSIARTASPDFQADFDPKTGQMAKIEQWPRFEYEEGERKARAEKATLESARDIITLRGGARMSDGGGSTSADEIVLEQTTGDFAAVGNVSSTRLPGKKAAAAANQPVKSESGMLANDQPVQARADRMLTADDSQRIEYEGSAVMWQGANRLQARRILIHRGLGTIDAFGQVVSQFPDQSQGGGAAKAKARNSPIFTVIRSEELNYSDREKLAHYKRNVVLERPTLQVKSQELRAWFVDEKKGDTTESKLDHLFADGKVDIVDRMPDRTRRGAGEHAEYYLAEEKMILTGGAPLLNDSKRGITRGNILTWFSREDRLIVDNTGSGPSVSRILRK